MNNAEEIGFKEIMLLLYFMQEIAMDRSLDDP